MKKIFIIPLILTSSLICSCGANSDGGSFDAKAQGTYHVEDLKCPRVDTEGLEPNAYLSVPYMMQEKDHCGPASLSMVMAYYGQDVDQLELGAGIVGEMGVTTGELSSRATEYGFDSFIYSCGLESLLYYVSKGKPVIARIINPSGTNGHFVIVIGYDMNEKMLYINDPGDYERTEISFHDFQEDWDVNSLEESNNSWNQMILVTPSI